MSLDEYFTFEEASDNKHEFVNGMVYDLGSMPSNCTMATPENHILITGELYRQLGNHLEDTACCPFPSGFRLKIESCNLYIYPDVSVICGETRFADKRRDTFINPTVLVEVLSDSTEMYDRVKKAEFYRTISSLQEYLLIAQDRPHVERYRRQEHGWLFTEYSTLEDEVVLDSIGCTLTLGAIYRRVRFDDVQA